MIGKIRRAIRTLARSERQLDDLAVSQGAILSRLNRAADFSALCDYEFKVFSQWGEDGIIDFLTSELNIENSTFIEFGIQDFSESNCRFLMTHRNWRGFVIDGSQDNISRLQASHYYWMRDLQAVCRFIDRDNINDILAKSGFDEDLGLLSVDLDGNDYHILKAIDGFSPRILVCEYNATFGQDRSISVPYDKAFVRSRAHHSNLYFGASLPAMQDLAGSMGYTFVGTNLAGVNAFFVRNDLMTDKLKAMADAAVVHPTRFRESRDKRGELTFLRDAARAEAIRGLPVVNTRTDELEKF